MRSFILYLSSAKDISSVKHIIISDDQFISLPYWDRDKEADISQTTFSNAFTWKKAWVLISLKCIPRFPINNMPALEQIKGSEPTRWQNIIWSNNG